MGKGTVQSAVYDGVRRGRMKIKRIISQYRRDFTAIYECEHCNHEEKRSGYDDSYFHTNVIPDMKCPKCGKKARDDYRPLATKYSDGMQV